MLQFELQLGRDEEYLLFLFRKREMVAADNKVPVGHVSGVRKLVTSGIYELHSYEDNLESLWSDDPKLGEIVGKDPTIGGEQSLSTQM